MRNSGSPSPGQHHNRLPPHQHTPSILLDINEQMVDTASSQCKSTLLQVTNYWDLAVVQVQLQSINHIKKNAGNTKTENNINTSLVNAADTSIAIPIGFWLFRVDQGWHYWAPSLHITPTPTPHSPPPLHPPALHLPPQPTFTPQLLTFFGWLTCWIAGLLDPWPGPPLPPPFIQHPHPHCH